MIKDRLEHAESYYGISNRLKIGFEWLKDNDLASLPNGKYLIEESDIYANVQSYETKEDAPYEAHRKYIDIQYIIKGRETIGVTDYHNCSVDKEYEKDKDIEFLHCNNSESRYSLNEGEFLVLFPQDAHKPSLISGEKLNVKKVVVKVAI